MTTSWLSRKFGWAKATAEEKTPEVIPYTTLDARQLSTRDTDLMAEGACTNIFRGKLNNSTTVAVKQYDLRKIRRLSTQGLIGFHEYPRHAYHLAIELAEQEAQALMQVQSSDHVVKLLGICPQYINKAPAVILQYLPESSLDKFITLYRQNFDSTKLFKIALDIAQGMQAVHAAGLIHGDINPTNILLDAEWNNAYLSDFQFSVQESKGKLTGGTASYVAPERTQEAKLTKAYDVYSFGITLLNLFCENPQKFEEMIMSSTKFTDDDTWTAVKDGTIHQRLKEYLKEWRAQQTYPTELMQLISDCLQIEPRKRPKASAIVATLHFIKLKVVHATPEPTPSKSIEIRVNAP